MVHIFVFSLINFDNFVILRANVVSPLNIKITYRCNTVTIYFVHTSLTDLNLFSPDGVMWMQKLEAPDRIKQLYYAICLMR
jgi:hypothetical protein